MTFGNHNWHMFETEYEEKERKLRKFEIENKELKKENERLKKELKDNEEFIKFLGVKHNFRIEKNK